MQLGAMTSAANFIVYAYAMLSSEPTLACPRSVRIWKPPGLGECFFFFRFGFPWCSHLLAGVTRAASLVYEPRLLQDNRRRGRRKFGRPSRWCSGFTSASDIQPHLWYHVPRTDLQHVVEIL